MVCKSTYVYDRVNKYTAKYLLIVDGQIKSKRLCRSTFCERDIVSSQAVLDTTRKACREKFSLELIFI